MSAAGFTFHLCMHYVFLFIFLQWRYMDLHRWCVKMRTSTFCNFLARGFNTFQFYTLKFWAQKGATWDGFFPVKLRVRPVNSFQKGFLLLPSTEAGLLLLKPALCSHLLDSRCAFTWQTVRFYSALSVGPPTRLVLLGKRSKDIVMMTRLTVNKLIINQRCSCHQTDCS